MKTKLSVMALGVLTALALALLAVAQEYPSWDAPLSVNATPVPGGTVTLSGSGFAPAALVSIDVFSDPINLVTVTADAAGEFETEVEIPANLEAGVHTIIASGEAPARLAFYNLPPISGEAAGSVTLTLGTRFTVEGDLSVTGNILPTGLIVVAALVGLAGLAAVLAARFTGAKAGN